MLDAFRNWWNTPQFVEIEPDDMTVSEELLLYEVVKKRVLRAQASSMNGEDKRLYVQSSVLGDYRDYKRVIPKMRDLNLAIEVAVREINI
jgi:hypothetical protein